MSTIKVPIESTKLIKVDPGNVDHNTVQLIIISEDDIRLSCCVGKLAYHVSCISRVSIPPWCGPYLRDLALLHEPYYNFQTLVYL